MYLLALVSASSADARPFSGIGGGAQLQYELTSLHDIDHEPQMAGAPQDFVMAGARLHGFVGGKRWGYHAGLDLAAGQTARPYGYLAYDVTLFPIGLALRFGETSFVSVGGGVGAMGAVGTLDDALNLPVELRFEIGRAHRLLGRVRASYLFNAEPRQNGAPSTNLADEIEASLGLRLGHAYSDFGFPTGDGYFVAASYKESMGARYLGVTLGFSIDMGTYRKKRSYRDDDMGCPDCE